MNVTISDKEMILLNDSFWPQSCESFSKKKGKDDLSCIGLKGMSTWKDIVVAIFEGNHVELLVLRISSVCEINRKAFGMHCCHAEFFV